jgi:hypothetical protein
MCMTSISGVVLYSYRADFVCILTLSSLFEFYVCYMPSSGTREIIRYAPCWHNAGNALYSCQVSCTHVCAMVPWEHAKAEASIRRFEMGTCHLRRENLTGRPRSTRTAGDDLELTIQTTKMICCEIRSKSSLKDRMASNSRAHTGLLLLLMMMMIICSLRLELVAYFYAERSLIFFRQSISAHFISRTYESREKKHVIVNLHAPRDVSPM